MQRRWLVVGLTVALLGAGTTSVLVLHGGDHRASTASLVVAEAPASSASPDEQPTPTTTTDVTAGPSPSRTAAPTRAATGGPAAGSGALPARCRGPLPPGQPADPTCDALHPRSGLPHPCVGIRNSCGWPDAHGAVPGGQASMTVSVRGTSLHVTWTSTDLAGDGNQGPVHEFVLRLARPGTEQVLVTRRLPVSTFSTDFTGLAPGSYDVISYELNDSGLGAGFCDTYTVAAPPPPSPSAPPAATSTPSASPTSSPS